MDMNAAKMKSLEELIAAMDGHMLEPFNKKGKGKDMMPEMAPEAEPSDPVAPEGSPDEESADSGELMKLLEMYKAQEGAEAPALK